MNCPRLVLPRSLPGLSVLLLLIGIAGCDGGAGIVIVPELSVVEGFENGFGAWTVAGLDTEVSGQASVGEIVEGDGSEGNRSARLRLASPTGTGKLWIERAFMLTPERSYVVSITLDVRALEAGAGEAWRVLAGAHTEPPRSNAVLAIQDAIVPPADTDWASHAYTVRADADEEGLLFVAIGVWSVTAGTRSHDFDAIQISFTRAN